MSQTENRRHQVGLFLNPMGQRRIDFQAACGEQFGRLFLADGVEQANDLLAQQQVDLLVIDLERFEIGIDLAALGALVARREGAPTLLVCPFANAGWLPALMVFGPVEYLIAPTIDAELKEYMGRSLPAACPAELRTLLALRSRVQQALAEADDPDRLAAQLCIALCEWPGVLHASLFRLDDTGSLRLAAQHAPNGFDLAPLLGGSERLLQAPLRHVFPALVAAGDGELALLDAPEKAGVPELAIALREQGVAMVLGLPIGTRGAPGASACLMFGRRQRFSQDEFSTLSDLAQLAGFGLQMAQASREAEQLVEQLAFQAITDALTGVANRRRGEQLLEQEIRRARRYKTPLALIGFDIDHFREINDRYGHPCGDTALCTVAAATRALLRSCDMLVRSGGQEFQVIVPHTSAIDALKIAEKIRLAMSHTPIPGCDRLTVSLGVAQLGEQESGDALALRVNAAVARAKRAGRNCVELAMA
jgi:diguanylate cyclase (GGDEF)-like protein